jgi:arylsulfatase A-like enzyme
LAAVALLAAPTAAAPARRPNVLVAIADDWGFPHAAVLGDPVARTPAFDRVAREGALFSRAFAASPSCTPSRASLLTGQAPPRLREGANLWSVLPSRYAVYPDLLERAGYVVGMTGKGWGPGSVARSGRTRNPAGPAFASFRAFLQARPKDAPFCFWLGTTDPHRPYDRGSGARAGFSLAQVRVPPYLPDVAAVREDLTDYYAEVERFDRLVGDALEALAAEGLLDDTLVVVTSDNGHPFPRAKANLYDAGTHVPLALRWPGRVRSGATSEALVTLTDLAPTILSAAGLPQPRGMTGESLLPLVSRARPSSARDAIVTMLERHSECRRGLAGYPARAVRTREHLYIRNFRPDRWPAGDPDWPAEPFRDIDGFGSPTKAHLLDHRSDPAIAPLFALACDKRPAEELYDLRADPDQLTNVAGRPEHGATLRRLRARLSRWMRATADPRGRVDDDAFDSYEYIRRED